MVVLSGNSKSVPSLGAGFRPRDGLGSGYRARVNLITKVLDFVQLGGPCGTVLETFELVVELQRLQDFGREVSLQESFDWSASRNIPRNSPVPWAFPLPRSLTKSSRFQLIVVPCLAI